MPALIPDTSSWLIETKLHPPLVRSDTIRRPHLEEVLRRSASTSPLTLLSAPAGYGKTTMLAELSRLLPDHPIAWITLDAEDNDPVRFFSLVTVALHRINPECGGSPWPWLSGGTPGAAGLKRAAGALINDVARCLPEPFIIVLDDLHSITEASIFVALEHLLDYQPPQMHIVVGTRHDPPLRLARLAARRQLAELRRPDLGFTPDETSLLLNGISGLDLSREEVNALQERTEGWPAGLCLLSGPLGRLANPADRSQFMATVVQSERVALDFLAEEVLRDFPEDVREFLMRTSVLAEMTPASCRAVTGRQDSADVLEMLYRKNLTIASFASGEDGEPVYRHHALFARLLVRQLQHELPDEFVELHRRAAEVQKTPGRAIAHYLAAELWEEAAEQMESAGMLLLHQGMAETVRGWYAALPAATRAGHPRLSVIVGRCEIHRGDYDAAGVLLRQARAAFVAAGDEAGEGEALASLITLSYQGNDRAAASSFVERALQLPLTPLGKVAALLGRAWGQMPCGHWDAIRADVRRALDIPHATGDRRADLIGITYMSAPLAAVPGCLELTEHYCSEASALAPPETAWRLGADELGTWPLLWRGKVEEALARAEAAEGLRQQLAAYPFVGNDLPIILATLHIAKGRLESARQTLDTLLKRLEGAPYGKRDFYLHAAGKLLAILKRCNEARGYLERLKELPYSPFGQYLCAHLDGLIALLEGQAEAVAILERAADMEARLPIAWVGGSARLLRARLLLDRGRPDDAVAVIVPVLNEWAEGDTPGCVLLDGPVVVPALQLAADKGIEYARRLLKMFRGAGETGDSGSGRPVPAGELAAALPEPLTQREWEVLRLIVAGCTNREIGQALFISSETVKSHVVHILRKLTVSSRTQAAIRGRELGL